LLNLLYLQAFALTSALGLRYPGVLLMGALIIIPPATAKRLARNLGQMLMMAVTNVAPWRRGAQSDRPPVLGTAQ
jgi:ABC-type Mn2+/Zn2+ transport system permease subunit